MDNAGYRCATLFKSVCYLPQSPMIFELTLYTYRCHSVVLFGRTIHRTNFPRRYIAVQLEWHILPAAYVRVDDMIAIYAGPDGLTQLAWAYTSADSVSLHLKDKGPTPVPYGSHTLYFESAGIQTYHATETLFKVLGIKLWPSAACKPAFSARRQQQSAFSQCQLLQRPSQRK